jgi:hypothetical protein
MTMLAHTRDPFSPASYSPERRDKAGAGTTNGDDQALLPVRPCGPGGR